MNAAHSKNGMGLHDVYEPLDPPYRREIPIYKPSDRIGLPYVQVDPKKIIGVVEVNTPDQARSFTAPDLSPTRLDKMLPTSWQLT